MASSIVLTHTSKSMLLGLPPELRQMVFRHLFTGITLKKKSFDFMAGEEQPPCAILLVCKLCYLEALPALYHFSTFSFVPGYDELAKFIPLFLPADAKKVTSMKLDDVRPPPFRSKLLVHGDALHIAPSFLKELLQAFPNLKKLRIACNRCCQVKSRQVTPFDW